MCLFSAVHHQLVVRNQVCGGKALHPRPFLRRPPVTFATTVTTRNETHCSFLREMSERRRWRGVSEWEVAWSTTKSKHFVCLKPLIRISSGKVTFFFPLHFVPHSTSLCESVGKPQTVTFRLTDRLILGFGLLRRMAQTLMFTSVSQLALLWMETKKVQENPME